MCLKPSKPIKDIKCYKYKLYHSTNFEASCVKEFLVYSCDN